MLYDDLEKSIFQSRHFIEEDDGVIVIIVTIDTGMEMLILLHWNFNYFCVLRYNCFHYSCIFHSIVFHSSEKISICCMKSISIFFNKNKNCVSITDKI